MSKVNEGAKFVYGSSLPKVKNARLAEVRNEDIDMVTKETIKKNSTWLA